MGTFSDRKMHRFGKRSNLACGIPAPSAEKFDACFPNRRLSNWEKFELRDYCQAHGLEMPPNPTLPDFIRIIGRKPEPIT